MEDDFVELEKCRRDMAEYFCEDETTFKLENLFKTIHSFVIRFKKAIQVYYTCPKIYSLIYFFINSCPFKFTNSYL